MMQPGLKSLFEGFNREADSFSGQFGLAAQRLDANEPILYYAGDVFPTASVIKLVVLAEYLAQVSTGELLPDQEIVIRAKDRVGGSGVIKDLAPGLRFRLADLATLAITVSDNTAANLLINRVGGLERINTRLQALGLRQTNMGRPFVFDSPGNNTGTPADFLQLLLLLARHQLTNPTVSQQMLDIMSRQQYLHFIPRYLPFHPYAADYGLSQILTVANKVGMLPGTINDAAIISTQSWAYALVIFTRDCQDIRPDTDNEGALLVARLSKRIYDYYLRSKEAE
jgi:beta-lactamase class A